MVTFLIDLCVKSNLIYKINFYLLITLICLIIFKSYKTNIFTQLSWLLWRNSLGIIREPAIFKVHLFQTMVVNLKNLF